VGTARLEEHFAERASRGVVTDHQGKAIDTLLDTATYDVLHDKVVCMEIKCVLEDNHRKINALLKMGVRLIKRYRVYEMKFE
jgi:hypothetical protein